MRLRFLAPLLLALLAWSPARALAAEDAEAAKTHFAAGVRLYDAHDYAAALSEFQTAYAAKKSPQIKRNIALCLRGLGRYPEALEAMEELLAEGGDALKPEVKEGAKTAIAEMRPQVAVVRLRVVYTGHTAPTSMAITVDDKPVTPERLAKPMYVMPGDHVFRATATGYYPSEQRAKLAAGGQETVIELAVVALEVAPRGRLTVQTNVLASHIAIDGVEVGIGSWTGDVPAGAHRLEASAQGYPSHAATVTVPANGQEAWTVDMSSPDVTPSFTPASHVVREWYLSGGLGIFGEAMTPTARLGGDSTKRTFGGAGVVAHGGRWFGKHLALGLGLELGALGTKTYKDTSSGLGSTSSTGNVELAVVDWLVVPEIRVQTAGKFRGFGGLGIGVGGQSVTGKLSSHTEKGSSVSAVGVVEGGGQFELGRAFLEASVFVDVHGTGTLDSAGFRYFEDSPTVRGGVRVLAGYTF